MSYAYLAIFQGYQRQPERGEPFCQKAVEILEKFKQDNPTRHEVKSMLSWVLTNRGDLLAASGRWRAGADMYAQAIETNEKDWQYLFQWALLELAAGDAAGYRDVCARLFREHGDTKDPFVAFVVTLTCAVGDDSGVSIDQILRLADQAVRSDRNNPVFAAAVGVAQFRAGQTDKAIDTLKKALPLHAVAALIASAQSDQIQVSRLVGETILARAYDQ